MTKIVKDMKNKVCNSNSIELITEASFANMEDVCKSLRDWYIDCNGEGSDDSWWTNLYKSMTDWQLLLELFFSEGDSNSTKDCGWNIQYVTITDKHPFPETWRGVWGTNKYYDNGMCGQPEIDYICRGTIVPGKIFPKFKAKKIKK